MYVLLMVYFMNNTNVGHVTTLSQEFSSKQTCEAALNEMKKQSEPKDLYRPRIAAATCTRK